MFLRSAGNYSAFYSRCRAREQEFPQATGSGAHVFPISKFCHFLRGGIPSRQLCRIQSWSNCNQRKSFSSRFASLEANELPLFPVLISFSEILRKNWLCPPSLQVILFLSLSTKAAFPTLALAPSVHQIRIEEMHILASGCRALKKRAVRVCSALRNCRIISLQVRLPRGLCNGESAEMEARVK